MYARQEVEYNQELRRKTIKAMYLEIPRIIKSQSFSLQISQAYKHDEQ
jgi:hypothetical protein